MKLYGDITKLSGYNLDPVDLIVGGSPCQDLSIAGNRNGLQGERSGLFMEMIRVIREMREKTNGIHPRYALWENVPGAFSSNNGRDFSAVLGEFARLIEPNAPDVPVPSEGWRNSGVLLVGGGGSIAYRVVDAQFWGKTIRDSRTGDVLAMGTPQRRRRIALVVDLRGQTAPEILFEQYGMSGDIEPCETQREGVTGTAAESIRNASAFIGKLSGKTFGIGYQDECAPSMDTSGGGNVVIWRRKKYSVPEFSGTLRETGGGKGILLQKDHTGALSMMNNQYVFDSQPHHEFKEMGEVSQSVIAQYGTGGNNMPFVVDERHDGETVYCLAGNGIDRAETAGCNGKGWTEDISFTLNTIDRPAVATMQGLGDYKMGDIASSLKQRDSKDATDQVCRVEETVMKYDALGVDTQSVTGSTLKARNDGQSNCDLAVNESKFTVRRLTPLECTRLQGYPDDWLDIPGASDSQKYKALGNSICLPFWEWLAHRFAEIGEVKTIGSLFDGISGFPLVFKRAGCETLWTSEIDPFCQKVCQYHLDKGDL